MTTLSPAYLIETRGNIVNVSSAVGSRPFLGFLVYGMSKSAVNMMTGAIALEVGPKGVRVNSVNPGTIDRTISSNAWDIPMKLVTSSWNA